MEDLLPQIANVGFPVVLSMYPLVRIERKLEVLTTAVTDPIKAILDRQ